MIPHHRHDLSPARLPGGSLGKASDLNFELWLRRQLRELADRVVVPYRELPLMPRRVPRPL